MTAISKTTNGGPPRDNVAKGLGAFSFALGLPQVLAPGRVNRLIGLRDDATTRMWMRAVGMRELVAGMGIFSRRHPTEWLWARVAGDTMDLALLGSALRAKSSAPTRTLFAAGAVAGAFAADLADSVRLTRTRQDAGESETTGAMQLAAAITVRRDREELYAAWRDVERFPSFMAHLEEVTATGPDRSHWKARGPLGLDVEWDAEITEDVPGERISWRSLEGAKVENSGSVRFVDAPGDQL
ncbi:MAG TPA: SRPBCC family protein, partial [Solirubrobacteraceae bacterium]|nr:SRPBCC family protein [Solirubrobacteraceae bacterium]